MTLTCSKCGIHKHTSDIQVRWTRVNKEVHVRRTIYMSCILCRESATIHSSWVQPSEPIRAGGKR